MFRGFLREITKDAPRIAQAGAAWQLFQEL